MVLTVDQLLAQVNTKIDESDIRVPEGSRAGRYVDLRSFRFYRHQQLVDPPAEKRGVAGLYCERHLLQLVAIKTLQARWVPLPEIRKQLAHASDDELCRMASTPKAAKAASVSPSVSPSAARTTNTARVWMELRLNEGAYAMVAQDALMHSRPSDLRALGERFTSMLLAAGG
jgi:DNA-binding transcriptional MerR regulator